MQDRLGDLRNVVARKNPALALIMVQTPSVILSPVESFLPGYVGLQVCVGHVGFDMLFVTPLNPLLL